MIRKKRFDLAEMLARVSPDSLHSEADFGPPAGREPPLTVGEVLSKLGVILQRH